MDTSNSNAAVRWRHNPGTFQHSHFGNRVVLHNRSENSFRLQFISMTIKAWCLLLISIVFWPFESNAQWRPSVSAGKDFRVDFRAKVHGDFRGFNPHLKTEEGAFDLNRARFGVEGRFLRHFQYEAEYEFRETLGGRDVKYPLRDAFVNFDYFDDFQLQVGKFKLPFSQEQNTSAANLDFVLRSRIADNLAPGRDIGAMLHGRFFNRG